LFQGIAEVGTAVLGVGVGSALLYGETFAQAPVDLLFDVPFSASNSIQTLPFEDVLATITDPAGDMISMELLEAATTLYEAAVTIEDFLIGVAILL
jgi:hypothetical protein